VCDNTSTKILPIVLMEEVNFWVGKEYIAYAIVNGLIGSVALWSFWTPFISFLALPIASAVMKQDICKGVNILPSSHILPRTTANAGQILLNKDYESLTYLNQGNIVSLWLLAAFAITLSLWIASSIIQKANLDINHIIKLNSILFVIIITIELGFFMGVGLKFIPFNLKDVYYETINEVTTNMAPYT
jgi:hypothetical protein